MIMPGPCETRIQQAQGVLDNPIWEALTSLHEPFALGDNLARRYHKIMSPLGAMVDTSSEAYESLKPLVLQEGTIALFLEEPVNPPTEDWIIVRAFPMAQMICNELKPARPIDAQIEMLDKSAVPEMLALTALTQPGPFSERTCEMGHYYGIWVDGKLIAMSGERLHMPGFTEVSAVCTHPDFLGKGYAAALVTQVCQDILARGEMPFLHVKADNDRAIAVYERLGFTHRREMHLGVLNYPAI